MQLKIRYLMMTFRCPSDMFITSWLFTARWSTWPGNHLVLCVAELVGSCIPIHALRCFPNPRCIFYPSGLSLCLSVDHFFLPCPSRWHGSLPRRGLWWLTCELHCPTLPCPGGLGLCTNCEKVQFFLMLLILRPSFLPDSLWDPNTSMDSIRRALKTFECIRVAKNW